MEVVVTAGAISRAKLQSNHHHQQANTKSFLQAGCPSCRPTNSVKVLYFPNSFEKYFSSCKILFFQNTYLNCTSLNWRRSSMQRWAWERIERGNLLLRCRLQARSARRRFGAHRRRWAGAYIVAAARLKLVWVEISAWNVFSASPFTHIYQTICKTRDSFIGFTESYPISSTVRLLVQKPFWASDEVFKIASCFAPQTYLHSIRIWRVIRWSLFLFKHLLTVLLEKHVQCAQTPMHLVKSAAPSGSSCLHCSMNFYSRNYLITSITVYNNINTNITSQCCHVKVALTFVEKNEN